jgi:hypothetical protein
MKLDAPYLASNPVPTASVVLGAMQGQPLPLHVAVLPQHIVSGCTAFELAEHITRATAAHHNGVSAALTTIESWSRMSLTNLLHRLTITSASNTHDGCTSSTVAQAFADPAHTMPPGTAILQG